MIFLSLWPFRPREGTIVMLSKALILSTKQAHQAQLRIINLNDEIRSAEEVTGFIFKYSLLHFNLIISEGDVIRSWS